MNQVNPDAYYVAEYIGVTDEYVIKKEFASFEGAMQHAKTLDLNQRNILTGARLIEMGVTEY